MPLITSATLGPNVPLSATRYFNQNTETIDLTSESETSLYTDQITVDDNDDNNSITPEGDDDEKELVRELTPREIERLKAGLARRARLPPGHRELRTTKNSTDLEIRAGTDVRLKDGNFFRVRRIIQNPDSNVYLAGNLMTRNRNIYYGLSPSSGEPLHAVLPMPRNDLCMLIKRDIRSPDDDECLETVSPEEVDVERKIIFTNQCWQNVSYYTENNLCEETHTKSYIEEHGALCCRWKYVEEIDLHAKKAKAIGHRLVLLRQEECDKGRGVPDVVLRSRYGKQKSPTPTLKSQLVDLTFGDRPSRKRKYKDEEEEVQVSDRNLVYKRRSVSVVEERFSRRGRRRNQSDLVPETNPDSYTFADVCAGGGGATRGGVMAGLDPKWVLDCSDIAIATLRQNFPRSKHLRTTVENFVVDIVFNDDYTVDVLHVSLPCQGHSPRNRHPTSERAFEQNVLGTSLQQLLEKCKPRLVTLEQTFGILTRNEGHFFRMAISDLTHKGYSPQWRVCKFREQGIPSDRKRLIIVAACPGEKLPEWPLATHGNGRGQKPFVTIHEGIRDIPAGTTLHDIPAQKRRHREKPRQLDVLNIHEPLREVIDTGGIKGLHPDGYYPTLRQQMRLQTFPDYHTLTGSTQKDFTTQIGNAVPCIFMKQLFRQCIRRLKESDREAAAWRNETITLD